MPTTEMIRTGGQSPLSRWALTKLALRSYWSGPISLKSPEIVRLLGVGGPTSTGVAVSEWTALNYSAFWSAVNLVSSDIAARPLEFYKRGVDGARAKQTQARLYRLLHDQPNPECTSVVWRKVVQAHAMTWGSGYTEIERDGAGRAVGFWPLTPDRVTPFRRGVDAALQYRVLNPSGSETIFDAGDILHIHGLGFDATRGYNIVQHAREAIGLGLATETFGGTFFGNGSTFGGVISYPGDPSDLVKKETREALATRHQGVERAHKLLALYGGAKYEQIGIAPELAQFLETRQFQVSEIARWFNIPPHKLAELSRSTNNNIEQQTIDYYTMTLLPWFEVWEQELESKLISPLERNLFYIKHNATAMLRGDAAARGELYSKRFQSGSLTGNDIRALEDEAPLPGGDDAFVSLNMIPISLSKPYYEAQIKKLSEPPPPPPAPAPSGPTPQEVKAITDGIEARMAEYATKVVEETALRAAAETKLDTATRELTGVREELALACTAHAGTRATLDTATEARDAAAATVATLTATLEAMTQERDTVKRQATQAAADLTEARAEIAGLRDERDAINAARDSATTVAETAVAEAQRATVAAAAATARADGLATEVARLSDALGTMTAERDRAVVATESAGLMIVTLTAERDAATGTADAAQAARDTAEAVIVELRARIEAVETLERAAREAATAADVFRAAADTRAEVAEAGRLAAEAAAAEAATDLRAEQHRIVTARPAIRAVFEHALQRVIQKETDRARKHVSSPEKFSKWVETFYPLHEDACRSALRPAVRAWLALHGHLDDVDATVNALVVNHIGQSVRQLRAAMDDADADTLPRAIERVLCAWEADRAETTIDTLLRKVA